MNISDVNHSVSRRRRRKRVGRGEGSGYGKTSGRGHKGFGQRGRSSLVRFEGGQMQIFRTTPKRGFSNAQFRVVFLPVNLRALEKLFADGETVDPAALRAKGYSKDVAHVKILGGGELSKKLTVKAHAFSAAARQKIEAAGGTVEVLPAASAAESAESNA